MDIIFCKVGIVIYLMGVCEGGNIATVYMASPKGKFKGR